MSITPAAISNCSMYVKPGFHSNAIACVSCGFRLRNARNASDCVRLNGNRALYSLTSRPERRFVLSESRCNVWWHHRWTCTAPLSVPCQIGFHAPPRRSSECQCRTLGLTHIATGAYSVAQKKNGATISLQIFWNSMTELRGNWWTSAILYAEHSH